MSARETMKNVLSSHNLMHIASLDANGNPCVRGVDFVVSEKENILYFISGKNTRKVEQIKNNSNISFSIDRDCPTVAELKELKYIKGTGHAYVLETPEENQKAFGLLMQKFPFFDDLPGDPSDFIGIKVELKNVLVSDNTINFGHTEEIAF